MRTVTAQQRIRLLDFLIPLIGVGGATFFLYTLVWLHWNSPDVAYGDMMLFPTLMHMASSVLWAGYWFARRGDNGRPPGTKLAFAMVVLTAAGSTLTMGMALQGDQQALLSAQMTAVVAD